MTLRARKINSIFIILKNKIIWFLLYLVNFPFLILLILIFPFIKIRINELETRSIGHFSITTEIFLSEIEKKKHLNQSGVFIWFINEKISNVFLLNKWREKLIIGPRFILYPLFKMINEFEFLKFMRTPFRHWKYQGPNKNDLWQIRDIHQVLQKTKPNIKFNKRGRSN